MKKEKDLGSDEPLLELFQDELKLQLEELDKLIKKLLVDGALPTILDQGIRCTHSIKGAAKLINLEAVILLSNAMEMLFRALFEKTASLNDFHLTLLFRSTKLLQVITNCRVSKLQKILKGEYDNFIQLTSELEQSLVSGFRNNLAAEHKDIQANTENIEKFLKDLKMETKILIDHTSYLRSGFENKEILEEMASASENIKKIGDSLHSSIVMQLGEALETCFKTASNEQLIWTQGHLDLIFESIDFLRRLSDCNSYNLNSWLATHEKNIEAIASVILAISKEASTIPARKKNKIEEIASKSDKEMPESSDALDESFFHDPAMLDLFYGELEQRAMELNAGILLLETHTNDEKNLEGLMRAAHSLKGAARIVDLSLIARLAHTMEDFFIAVQKRSIQVSENKIDELLHGVDLFSRLSQVPYNGIREWIKSRTFEIENLIKTISAMVEDSSIIYEKKIEEKSPYSATSEDLSRVQKYLIKEKKKAIKKNIEKQQNDSFLRVSAVNLNKLMGLAGESLVESGWLVPFSESLLLLKREQSQLTSNIDSLYQQALLELPDSYMCSQILALKQDLYHCQKKLSEKITDLDLFIRRQSSLSERLYTEVINSRMRPLADGIEPFPRLVRDLAKQLHKKVNLVILGKQIPVDREILEKLEAPLNHLLRNAVDHGIELPKDRLAAGKNETGTIILEACHKGGMLSITVSDDGKGIDIEDLRKKIIEKGFISANMAEKLNETELLEFLFLPGFSTSEEVTELSGRGIGLNVVQNMVQEIGGNFKTFLDVGLVIQLQLPLTLSVIHALLVEISDEVYAFPLARLNKVLTISKNEVHSIENKFYFSSGGKNIGLIHAYHFLELPPPTQTSDALSVIVLNDHMNDYGVIVDRFISEKELVVQELDPMLGKIQDISGGAFMEDGLPVLIIDVEDMIRSIDKIIAKGNHYRIEFDALQQKEKKKKRILVVDDSVTVREVESRLLQDEGYLVDVAINGLDAWNAVRLEEYDLIITDIDMPRMTGIEFIKVMRSDPKFKKTPVMIVSYKESEIDRIEGINAGADFYLTKSSFQDEGLLETVSNLIGKS